MNETIIKDFVKAIKAENKRPSAYDTTATVTRIDGDIAWVHIPGGVDETPVKRTIDAKKGDTVQVRVGGGTAYLIGNASAPPTDDTKANIADEKAVSAKKTADKADSKATAAKDAVDHVVQHFWTDEAGAHVTEVPQEEWSDVGDPTYHSGGNVLIQSTAVSVRDGLKDLAVMSKDGFDAKTYDAQGNEVVIAHLGYGEGRDDNDGTATAPYYTLGRRGISTTEYSPNRGYAVGDLCVYDNKVYVCVVQITSAEQWTPSHWKYYIGSYSFAEGFNVVASGYNSHAEGYSTTASGNYSHAEGYSTTARGNYSHAEGYYTKASNTLSHAEGDYTTSSGISSHAEGNQTTASGNYSHAEGNRTTASGSASHAEGFNTFANGSGSHAGGRYSEARGDSFAHGYYVSAPSTNSFVIGSYNVEDNSGDMNSAGEYLFTIGNGTSEDTRSNALTVAWDSTVAFGDPSKTFIVEEYTKSYSAISSGGVLNWSDPKSKTGYYPIGVVGFRTNMQALVVNMVKLSSVQSGQCTINMNARAVANVSAGTAQMYVLWIKET